MAPGTSHGRALPSFDPAAVDAFFAREGWSTTRHDIRWAFESRADFELAVRIEFAADQADRIIAEHFGCEVDYAIVIRRRDF